MKKLFYLLSFIFCLSSFVFPLRAADSTGVFTWRPRSAANNRPLIGKNVDLFQSGVKIYDLTEIVPGVYQDTIVSAVYDIYMDGIPYPGWQNQLLIGGDVSGALGDSTVGRPKMTYEVNQILNLAEDSPNAIHDSLDNYFPITTEEIASGAIIDSANAIVGITTTGNDKYYGTNGSGTPGFYTIAGTGGYQPDNVSIDLNGSNQLQVKDGGITTAKILDDNVTIDDIGDDAVSTSEIVNGSILPVDLHSTVADAWNSDIGDTAGVLRTETDSIITENDSKIAVRDDGAGYFSFIIDGNEILRLDNPTSTFPRFYRPDQNPVYLNSFWRFQNSYGILSEDAGSGSNDAVLYQDNADYIRVGDTNQEGVRFDINENTNVFRIDSLVVGINSDSPDSMLTVLDKGDINGSGRFQSNLLVGNKLTAAEIEADTLSINGKPVIGVVSDTFYYDFPNTATGAASVANKTFDGTPFAAGDPVTLGYSWYRTSATFFEAYAYSSNVVYINFINVSGGDVNPPPITFTITILINY